MNSKIWVIPVTILILVVIAWLFRWENAGQQGNKTYHYDRWISQGWVTVISPTAFYEMPVLSSEELNIEQNNQISILGMKEALDNNALIMRNDEQLNNDFQRYEKKGIYLHYQLQAHDISISNMSDEEKTILDDYLVSKDHKGAFSDTYINLKAAYDRYWKAYNDNKNLHNIAHDQAIQVLSKKAVSQRRLVSVGGTLLGLAALIWLIVFFVLSGKTSKHSEP
ncbi:MAG: hypothetical protein ABFD08_14150 [Syntrophomonas sp.]